MIVKRHILTVTTDSSGNATARTPQINGRIVTIIYTKDDYDNGVNFTLTLDDSGEGLWREDNVDASKTVSPRQNTHDILGVDVFVVSAGERVLDYIFPADDKVKIVIVDGGNAKSGKFAVITAS